MAALMLANGGDLSAHEGMNHEGMTMGMGEHDEPISNTVDFPYGFPSSGRYRIFVQMKHGTTIETGAFDVQVQ
jgi:hypothetical protein